MMGVLEPLCGGTYIDNPGRYDAERVFQPASVHMRLEFARKACGQELHGRLFQLIGPDLGGFMRNGRNWNINGARVIDALGDSR